MNRFWNPRLFLTMPDVIRWTRLLRRKWKIQSVRNSRLLKFGKKKEKNHTGRFWEMIMWRSQIHWLFSKFSWIFHVLLVVNSRVRNLEMRVELWRSWLVLDQSARDPRTHAHTISQGLESKLWESTNYLSFHYCPVYFFRTIFQSWKVLCVWAILTMQPKLAKPEWKRWTRSRPCPRSASSSSYSSYSQVAS